jgi:hypothetical protein
MISIKTPSNGNDTMSNRQTALILTFSYWIAAALAATFAPRSDWIDLRWPIAVYLFAIPTTILLWMVVIGVHFFRPAFRRSRFTLVGVALPFVYAAVAVAGGRWLSEGREQRPEEQWRIARLASFDDELLNGAKGPIGVRLRYSVVYPRGLDRDQDHGAFSQLGTSSSPSTFVMIRRVVAPRVSGHYQPGAYEIAEDLVPAFLPASLLYATSEPAASDHCFRWSANMSRQESRTENAALLAVAVYLSHSAIERSTRHPYRLADFYATAVQEGAVDCAN